MAKIKDMNRLDNSKGYSIENSVPCCKMCNLAKHANTYQEFVDMCVRVAERHGNGLG
jgi:hypothetical protein